MTPRSWEKCIFIGALRSTLTFIELLAGNDSWKPARLFIRTDINLTPEQIIESDGLRWSIEIMFNQLKLRWGLKETW